MADLTKLKEKMEEIEKHLNEEMEGRKGEIRKYDELKKRLLESEKKSKEYKHTIKKLSQQIVDLHNQKKKEPEGATQNLQTIKTPTEQETSGQKETDIGSSKF